MRWIGGSLATALCAAVAGCAPDALAIELDFPSQETFVRSDMASVIAIELSAERLGDCPELTMQAALQTLDERPVAGTGDLPICDFRDGAASLSNLDGGEKAFVVVVRNSAGQALLTGCTVRDPLADAQGLRIVLTTTEDYRRLFPPGAPPPDCASADEKCAGTCR